VRSAGAAVGCFPGNAVVVVVTHALDPAVDLEQELLATFLDQRLQFVALGFA
jgi:hypothetical protein